MHGNVNININVGNQHPHLGSHPMGFQGQNMMGMSPMMQMMQMLMQIMMMFMGGQMGQIGMPGAHPMPFGNPSFGHGGVGCGCGPSPMGGFLGAPTGPYGNAGHHGMPQVFNGYIPPTSQGGQRAVDVARQFLGRRSYDIRGQMPHFRAAGGLSNNCADFVSSALRSAGMLGGHEVNCRRLEQRLLREGWRQIPANQAGPGDVAFNQSRGHVVLCQGNGTMIGSNNVQRGLQYVTQKRLPQHWVIYRKG